VQPDAPRLFVAGDILAGRVSLDGYPFRHVCLCPFSTSDVRPGRDTREEVDGRLDLLLSATELLETRGWELVNVDHLATIACLRKRWAR